MRYLRMGAMAAAVAMAATAAWAAEDIELKTLTDSGLGAYLADGEARPIYTFEADARATGDRPAESRCHDACARTWPPVVDEDAPEVEVSDKKIDRSLIGYIEREDGKRQLTYRGWPLYYYAKDHAGAGTVVGQTVEDHGGKWHLMAPDGTVIRHKG